MTTSIWLSISITDERVHGRANIRPECGIVVTRLADELDPGPAEAGQLPAVIVDVDGQTRARDLQAGRVEREVPAWEGGGAPEPPGAGLGR